MSEELPLSLTEPLVADPARTIAADAVYRETAPGHRPAPMPGLLSGINWADPELLSVGATLVFHAPRRLRDIARPARRAQVLVFSRGLSRGRLARHDSRR